MTTVPEKYRMFSSAWESTPREEKTLDNPTARLLAKETKSKKDYGEMVAFRASEKGCFKYQFTKHLVNACKKSLHGKEYKCKDLKCFNCNKMGYMAREYKSRKGENSRLMYNLCKMCKETNHLKKDCFWAEKPKKSQTRRQ